MIKTSFWIIIPAFNAAPTIGKVLVELKNKYPAAIILVIDDGSTDRTSQIAENLKVRVSRHPANLGIGAALKQGLSIALQEGAKYLVTIGADDQRDVDEIVKVLEPLVLDEADLVVGSKFLGAVQPMPSERKLGNILLTRFFCWLYDTSITDLTSGFRALAPSLAQRVADLADGYAFDADLRILAMQYKFRCIEVPVRVFYHRESSRMKSAPLVGMQIFLTLLKRKIFPWPGKKRQLGIDSSSDQAVSCRQQAAGLPPQTAVVVPEKGPRQ